MNAQAMKLNMPDESRSGWLPLAAFWAYAVVIIVWLRAGWGGAAVSEAAANWGPVLAQGALLVYLALNLRKMAPGLRRVGWVLVSIAVGIDLCSVLFSLYASPTANKLYALCNDALFFFYYPVLACACAMFFIDLGGSFRSWRVWVDIATLSLSLGATVWLFLLSPALAAAGVNTSGAIISLLYSPAIAATIVIAALLFTQIMDWRNERALGFLIAAITLGFTADLGWLRARIVSDFPVDTWFDVAACCTLSALVATAVRLERHRIVPERSAQPGEVNPQSFLPTLAVLLAIAMLFGEQANSIGIGGWMLLGCALGGAVLLTARQLGARYELRRLNLALAMRHADERLTELERRSSDLVLIVDAKRRLAYVSPASDTMLGIAPAALRATPATRLLGPNNESRLVSFLDDIAERHLASNEITAAFTTPAGERRDVQIVGSDLRSNPVIAGIVLNIRDVTEQHRLEREVLEAVAIERCRLSSDIHEGLGQELAGIALLLKALKSKLACDPGSAQSSLTAITGHFSQTIELAREIARGLSPLQVVRGSLDQALVQLAADARDRFSMCVNFRSSIQGIRLSAGDADHIYRIVVEALNNAARHSSCSNVDVTLHADGDQLKLSVTDDGIGFRPGATSGKGLGLRMMGYRARAMGGNISIEPSSALGSRITVSVPIHHSPVARNSERRSALGIYDATVEHCIVSGVEKFSARENIGISGG